MTYDLIVEKLNALAPGQILMYYNFIPVQKEQNFVAFKNDNQVVVYVHLETNGDLGFIETTSFKTLNKIELFYYLTESLDTDQLVKVINEIGEVENEHIFNFSEPISSKKILDAYFSLELSEDFAYTAINDITYKRFGRDCIVFYKDKKAVDVVVFDENDSIVYSEFGNNFGYHFIDRDSNKLVITYNPNQLINFAYDQDDVLLSKFYPDLTEVIKIISSKQYKEIELPFKDLDTSFYRLSMLLGLYNFYNGEQSISIRQSPNGKFNEITLAFHGDFRRKVSVGNELAGIQKRIKEKFFMAPTHIQSLIGEYFKIDINIHSWENRHCATVTMRNNADINNVLFQYYSSKLNELASFRII